MSWLYLGIAVVFEVGVGIFAIKAHCFTHLWWMTASLSCVATDKWFIILALRSFYVD